MLRKERLLREQKILHLATIDGKGTPHLVPVWYKYTAKKLYIGTNTRTAKAKNIQKNNKVAFCIDVGVWHPIDGVMGTGKARLITKSPQVKDIAGKILLRYFKSLNQKSARELLDDTDCIIEIMPKKITSWHY